MSTSAEAHSFPRRRTDENLRYVSQGEIADIEPGWYSFQNDGFWWGPYGSEHLALSRAGRDMRAAAERRVRTRRLARKIINAMGEDVRSLL